MIGQLHEVVRRRGLGGTLLRANERLSPMTRWHDEYIYLELDVASAERPRRPLVDGLELRTGDHRDLALLEELPKDPEVTSMVPEIVTARLDRGALLWLVTEGPHVAFSCWTFRGRGPLTGAQGGDHPMPPDVVMLEDSISSPRVRGKGVAPAAWSAIADHHAQDGVRSMVTKVAVENEAVQHALQKVGFREVARMCRSGPIWHMRIDMRDAGGGPVDHWLAALAS